MYLLRTKTRHREMARLHADYADATTEALKFVGEHNPDDGCSMVPVVHASSRPSYFAFRSTSFGLRQARVDEINADEMKELLPW